MKELVTLLAFLSITVNLFSQDHIITKNGEEIECKITHEDTTAVYFTKLVHDKKIKTYVEKPLVKDVTYEVYPDEELERLMSQKHCFSIGFLMGGGSLAGADWEFKLVKNLSVQVGGGFVGYGGGINYHVKPYIRSSYISLQYWHQGLHESFTQSLVGPSYVFRVPKWFTAQIGLGFLLEEGPGMPEDTETSPVMLTYAIGAYFPW